jgi:hypothetical protein
MSGKGAANIGHDGGIGGYSYGGAASSAHGGGGGYGYGGSIHGHSSSGQFQFSLSLHFSVIFLSEIMSTNSVAFSSQANYTD